MRIIIVLMCIASGKRGLRSFEIGDRLDECANLSYRPYEQTPECVLEVDKNC